MTKVEKSEGEKMSEENPNIDAMSDSELQAYIAHLEDGKSILPDEKIILWQYACTLATARRMRATGRIQSALKREAELEKMYQQIKREGKGWL